MIRFRFPVSGFRKSVIASAAFALTVLYFSSNNNSFAFDPETKSGSDSAILAQHLREIKIEYAIEEFSDHSFNSHYSDKQLDSILLEDSRITFPNSKIVYAPDSAFKIAVIEGQSCGAYCNPFWKTWIHFNDGSGMVMNNAGFDNVTSIQQLSDGKYLIWESTYGRGGAVGYNTEAVTLLELKGHDIRYCPFPEIPSHERMDHSQNEKGTFSVYQTTGAEDELLCEFNPQTNLLEYQYSMDEFWSNEDDTCAVFKGAFKYKNGLFELQYETCKTEKPQ